ncbi:MAG: Hsp20/alpha crystallin family protein [Spirochaetaceae bacterium]
MEQLRRPNVGLFDRTASPEIDVVETEESFHVYCDLPGVEEKDMDISLAANVLTIKGEKRPPERQGEVKVYRREDWAGTFQRTLSLPKTVEPDSVEARLKDGVLTVTLSKRAEAKTRKIDIKVV